mgnify:CR=1 FL=1
MEPASQSVANLDSSLQPSADGAPSERELLRLLLRAGTPIEERSGSAVAWTTLAFDAGPHVHPGKHARGRVHAQRGDQVVPATRRRSLAAARGGPSGLVRLGRLQAAVPGVHVDHVNRPPGDHAQRPARPPRVDDGGVGLRRLLPLGREQEAGTAVAAIGNPLAGGVHRGARQEEADPVFSQVAGFVQRLSGMVVTRRQAVRVT